MPAAKNKWHLGIKSNFELIEFWVVPISKSALLTCYRNSNFVPKILDNHKQVISKETAYQVTSMLEGVVKRGTGKKLKILNVPLAGKTGTTNKNFDAWFIGSTSDLTIGVYVGYDEPKSLGKYETGAKAALPIFKKFIENALYKEEIKPFKVPKTINFFSIDYTSGKNTEFNAPNSIIEAFKEDNLEQIVISVMSLLQFSFL